MEKDNIFFGESGLTSTAANFIANLAKESYKALEEKLALIVFYTTHVSLLGSSEKSLIRQGESTVSDIEGNLKTIAQLKSLIAWLREALKAKERMVKRARAMSYEDFDIELPEAPEQLVPITMDDYVATLSIKERNRYYYLEILCATIGAYIHPDGTFAKEREAPATYRQGQPHIIVKPIKKMVCLVVRKGYPVLGPLAQLVRATDS